LQTFWRQGVLGPGPGRKSDPRWGLQPSRGPTDDAAVHPAVAALPYGEKGLVLGALLARMPPDVYAVRYSGAVGDRGRAALEALSGGHRGARASSLAALISLVRAPIPAGVERIHPGWLRERLAAESSAVIRAVTAGLPPEVRRVADEVLSQRQDDQEASLGAATLPAAAVAELCRRVFAGLVPLADLGAPAGPEAAALMTLSFTAVQEAIERRGAETLGVSLRGAPAAVVARAAAYLNGRLARALLDAAADSGPPEARAAARRLVERVAAEKPSDLAAHLGARALAVALIAEGGDAVQAIAQRLPPALGRRLSAFSNDVSDEASDEASDESAG
jgi:hypothetical protein